LSKRSGGCALGRPVDDFFIVDTVFSVRDVLVLSTHLEFVTPFLHVI